MYRKTIKAICGMAVASGLIGACIPSDLQAAGASLPLNYNSGWKDTGIIVAAGDPVTVQTRNILRYWDAMSLNSNGEWLYCPNRLAYLYPAKRAAGTYGESADNARTDSARPLPGAPGGALIFRIGSGTPFFVPRSGGTPGKDYTLELGEKLGYTKLPGHASLLSHQFIARESGPLFVSVNLSEKAKGAKVPNTTTSMWNWPAYAITILGERATECQVSGTIIDETGKALAEAEVKIGTSTKISGSDGSFMFILSKDGYYSVTAAKSGYLSAIKTVSVSLAKVGTLDCGDILLKTRPGILSGRVLTDDGKIVAGAQVIVGTLYTFTDKNGVFSAQVNKGTYTITASKILPSGLKASGVKANIEVLQGQATNAGSITIMQTIPLGGWMATSRVIQKGQTVVVKAGGELSKAAQRFGPDGLTGTPGGTGSILPGAAWGALVAKIGAGKPFVVGANKRFLAADAGTLYFAVNLTPADYKGLSGAFTFLELTVLDLGDIEGTILGSNGKPLTMAAVEVSGIEDKIYTDADGKFLLAEIPANKVYGITVTFPGYNPYIRNLTVLRGQRASLGSVTMKAAPVTGTVAIKLLPKSGSIGGVIPVFVEVINTSARNGLWGGYLVSLKAKAPLSGKEYPGMAPTYLVLAPGERRGTELICQLPAGSPAGDYTITAELRVPETVSIQDAAKQFQAKKDLEDKLSSIKELKGSIVARDAKKLNLVAGLADARIDPAFKLLIPTITPKVFSPKKGQIVTGNIALREKAVVVLGKELEIFKDKNGAPMLIWNSYEGLYLSSRKDGERKDDWVWIGQSSVESDDFTVNWDTSKFEDGDYLIRATMKTTYDGKPIEGSMTVMVKVRNDPRTGMIRGKVADEDGLPLKGVTVKRLARGQTVSGMDWDTFGTKSEVDWQAEDVLMTDAAGGYLFSGVLSGDHKLQFSLDNYSPVLNEVTLKAAQQINAPVVILKAAPCKIAGSVKLDDDASPAGAAVTLAGPSALTAFAGEAGKFAFEGLKKGAYKAAFSKDEYDGASLDFTCAPGEAKELQGVLLKRKFYAVTGTVKDESGKGLADVAVTLDQTVSRRMTDENGQFNIWNVSAGSHDLYFVKAGYEKAEKRFVTGDAVVNDSGGRTVQADAVMKLSDGTLSVTVDPADAKVTIDGAGVQAALGKYEAALAVGEHIIAVSKDGYDAAEQKAMVQSGKITAVEIKLVQQPPSKGTLTGSLEPASAQLLIDGAVVELKGNKYEAALTPGDHSVKASKENFVTFEQTMAIQSGAVLTLDIKLQNENRYDKDGYDKDGYDKDGFNKEGYDKAGFDKNGYDKAGFNKDGFDKAGFDKDGYDKAGFNKEGYDKSGYNKDGYDKAGFDKTGYDKSGFDKDGYDKAGFNKDGYDKLGFNKEGYDKSGYDKAGYDKAGLNKEGYDKSGYNKEGYDKSGYDKAGFDQAGYDKAGFNKDGYDKLGFNKEGYDKSGFDKDGYDKSGYDKDGYNKAGYDKDGYNKSGFDKDGYNKLGFDKDGYNKLGFDKDGYNKLGYDKEGYNKSGYDKDGYDRDGHDKDGYDKDGRNKDGYDRDGRDKDGYDKDGYNKDGYNKLGYDKDGYNKAGFDKDGYNKLGFDKDGYNKEGYDKDGYNKLGFDKDGYNKSGYDKDGYNKSGYDKDGHNKSGYDKEGYNKAGFDKDGYNNSGYDKDGYNKSGYDKDGYNKLGYDKDGFNKLGFDKDGYNKAGYDQDGYNKAGYDKDGYNKSGFDKDGYNKSGYDKDGYNKTGFDKDGYNKLGFDKDGYNKSGYDKAGYNKAGFDKTGYDKAGYNKDGYDKLGFDKDGYNKSGYDKDGYNKLGYDKDGYNKSGYDKDGYNKAGFDKDGYNKSGYDKDGYNKLGFDKDGYNKAGYDKDGFNKSGYDKDGYNKSGYDKDGYNKSGFDKDGYNKSGYDKDGYNESGYDKDGYNKSGFDKEGYNKAGFDKDGYNKSGYDKDGYNKAGYDKDGYDKSGFNKEGYDKSGFNKDGYDKSGYNKDGYDKSGFDKNGYNKAGYDKDGYNKAGFDKNGYDKAGFNKDGFDKDGYNKLGYDQDGYNKSGYDKDGYNKSGYDKDGYNKSGYDKDGYNKSGYDKDGYNKSGYDKDGYNKLGYDKDGYNKSGYDKDGYNKLGYDKDGYNKSGFDKDGYNKAGYDKDGYDKAGFNKDGYDQAGYNKDGYDKSGYNKAGFDKTGYDKAGFDKDGYNKSGYDKDGYNKSGYDKDGYNKAGYDKDGYNKLGYDKDGYNKLGFDKDGYNKLGFDKDGYNKAGYDKDGYNKSGYDKDGYNKSGFDKDGYNKSGRDKDGYDKSNRDKDGYDKSGRDKDGYDKSSRDKDGYDKSGLDKNGYRKGEGKLTGTLEPAAAQLLIDGAAVELKGNKYEAALAAGEHTVKALKDKFAAFEKKVVVQAGVTLTLDIKLANANLQAKPLALTPSAAQVIIGETVTLTVQAPEKDTEVELAAEQGQFEVTNKNSITGRADANGRFVAKWASLTPAKHKIKARVKDAAGKVTEEKETEIEVKYAVPEVDAVIKNVNGALNKGANLTIEAQVRNIGKVSGKYRFVLELRGAATMQLFPLKPVEVELSAGESKLAKFDWNVAVVGAYNAKLLVYLVGDTGALQLVKTFQAQLKFKTLPKAR